jgi:hypothetical protein
MIDFLQGECGHTLIGLVTIVVLFGAPFIVVGWALWLKHRQRELDAELKREMIERGMSADDIIRVLNAGSPEERTPRLREGPNSRPS